MTDRSDLDRVLRNWLEDGPTAMPDRVVDVVAHRISVRPQRRPWRLIRRSSMSPVFKWGAAAAAVLVIAVVGYNLLPGRGGTGGPYATPKPTSVPSPTAPPSAPSATTPPITESVLEAGTYRLQPFGSAPTMYFDATVPSGWGGVPSWAILAPGGSDAPDGLGIAFMRADGLFGDPCHWDLNGTGAFDQPGDVVVGPSVNDLVTALRANSAYTSSTPTVVTIGEYAGQRLDIELPTDLDFATCDIADGTSSGVYFVFSGFESGLFAQGRANRYQVSILDVAGKRVVIVLNDYAGTPAAVRTAAQTIVDSLVIHP